MFNKLCPGHGMSPAAVTSVEWFLVNHVASATRALIYPVTLTYDLLTLKQVHIIAHGVDNLPANFGVSGTFRSLLMSQRLSDASCDLATLTFDLGGTCR